MHATVDGDQDVIDRLKKKDESALEDLMSRYEARVFGLAFRLVGSREDAQEVLQDVFWSVFEKIDTFRGDSKLSSWIYRITTNASLMKLRRQPRIQEIPLEEELGPAISEEGKLAEPVADWSRLPDDELLRKELSQRIEEAMNLLPADYRSVFVLRDVEGLSAEESREILNISVAALKSRLHRARLFLRKQLSSYIASRQPELMPEKLHD